MANVNPDHSAQFQEPPSSIPSVNPSNATEQDFSSQFQEPIFPHASHDAPADGTHKSATTKIKEAVTKPFHKEKETPPALQEAIQGMEARKAATAQKMEDQGKDSSVLSGKRTDIVKEFDLEKLRRGGKH